MTRMLIVMTRMLQWIHLNIFVTQRVLISIVSILGFDEEVFTRGRSGLGLPTCHGK